MNPLTQVKNIQKATARENAAGISEKGSWHERYKDSAYVNIGLLPFELTEGDLLAIFAQYGEVVDVNLVRDKATGKSRGFAFLAYEDQRSTVLAVDNLNGAKVVGRTIRVDHVINYKKKVEEDAEEEQKKREERGVCYAFQRGECNRGDACKFSHDLERNANTGWGKKDDAPTWGRQRNGRSPPPPPWKQGNGLKDDPPPWRRSTANKDDPPPWRRSSASKDDPPPSRKENGSSSVTQNRDDDRPKPSQLPRRYDDRTRIDRPTSGSRQRISQTDDIPARGRDSHESARPSKRSGDIEDDYAVPTKRDNHSMSRRDGGQRSVSPDIGRSGKRQDDNAARQRHDSHLEDHTSPKRRSGTRRHDRYDSPPLTNHGIDNDRRAPRDSHRRDFSPHQRYDRHARANDVSPRKRHSLVIKDNDKSPDYETGTKRRRDFE